MFHYQEVHSSWAGAGAKILTAVGFRRGWNQATNTSAIARTADFTFTVGKGNRATFSDASFAGNYTASPTVMLTRTKISMPGRTAVLGVVVHTGRLPADAGALANIVAER